MPGSVLDDLWRAGEVPDPYFERNSLLLEWAPARAWVYRYRLAVPPDAVTPATLRFDGVDHRATVLVDGVVAAEHEGMFVPFQVDVTPLVEPGKQHLLAVVVHPAPESEPQVGDTGRVRAHKSRMGYGWDFCPRLVHTGIWRGVSLYTGAPVFCPSPVVVIGPDLREGQVSVDGAERLSLMDGADVAVSATGTRLVIPEPRLWWPNGEGAPHTYTLVADRGGQRRQWEVGFRHLELAANPGAPSSALPYTAVVNGRELFLRGWNWAPVDALYGVPRPQKLSHLLSLAAASGANCLRVWGGGLLETPEFYGWCDRLGLLVWQEFALSGSIFGSVPSDDPGFVAAMGSEAAAIVAERRHHPSLAWWCGGNELASSVAGRDDAPLDRSAPVLAALAEVVGREDPGRPFLPASPSGPHSLNRLELIGADPDGQHDVHGPWEHQGLASHNVLYDAGTCLLHSEVGVEGMANRRGLDRLVAPGHRWPADRSSPIYAHLGAWWDNAPLVQDCFGGRLTGTDQLRRASQHLQFDGLRYAVESRLRRRPRTSGVFPWQLNESYPNAWCTAAVDYWGDPKPAYYGVRRAYRPAHVCAAFPTWAWGGRDRVRAEVFAWAAGPALEGTVRATLFDVSGVVVAEQSFDLPPEGPGAAGALTAGAGDVGTEVCILDLEARWDSGPVAANRYVLTTTTDLSALLDLPPAVVEVRVQPSGAVRLRHLSGPAAVGVVLADGRPPGAPGWAMFGDNVLDLLPGEDRTVGVEWPGTGGEDLLLSVAGWNMGEQEVPALAPDRGPLPF